jgi:type I restriction enzyme, S subunit
MKYKRYPKYKDSGVEWMGEIPEHWEVRVIKRVGSIRYGLGEPPAELIGGLPLIRATNISRGKITTNEMMYVDPADVPWDRDPVLRKDDIVVVRSGAYTGDSAIMPDEYDGAIVGYDLVLRVKRAVPHFVAFTLLSPYVLESQIYAYRLRAAQPHLNAEQLGSTAVILPSLEEQAAIADFLERETAKIDALVAKKDRLIELLQEKRTALITHAVTKGLDPNVPLKLSGISWLGDIPKHWGVAPLCRYWQVVDCKHLTVPFVEEGVPLASVVEVQSFHLNLSRCKKTTSGWYRVLIEGGRKPRRGDIIYCRNVSVGASAFVDTDLNFAMGQDVCLIRSEDQNQQFLNYLLHSPFMAHQMELLLVGSTFKRINISEIKSLLVLIPPIEEQDLICRYLDLALAGLDSIITKTEHQIALLQEYRTALISAAVTGKIDVREGVA